MKKTFLLPGILLPAITFVLTSCKRDDTPPVITLNGGSPVYAYKGETFTDPGATAMDETDGDLTVHISTSGTVGAEAGYYNINYSVIDNSSNFASADRQVIRKYKNSYLEGTYNVTETSPFGTVTYTGTVIAGTSDDAEFVFGSTSAPEPIVVDAKITGLDDIEVLTVAQGGPLDQFEGNISESTGPVTFTLSYLRPINSTTTNCTATWTKQ